MTLVASSGVFVLPIENETGGAKARREPRVVRLRPLEALEEPHPAVERVTRRVAHRVLHEEGHAPERARGPRCRGSLTTGAIETLVDHRVERRVRALDAGDGGVDELRR